jgi:hypothetical protein
MLGMVRWGALLMVVAVGAGGACGNAGERPPEPRIVDLEGGAKRVRLYGNDVARVEEGWNLATARITGGPDDSDFYLSTYRIVRLVPTTEMNGLCRKEPAAGAPAFARVEDVPGDADSCVSWNNSVLGELGDHTESQYAGQGFLVRDRAGVVAAKLLTVADDIMNGDVNVTLDIIGL